MFLLLSVICICITTVFVVHLLQEKPITFVVHKKLEEIRPEPTPLTAEEKKALEDQQELNDGMNKVIRFAQEFLGGDVDAEPKQQTE